MDLIMYHKNCPDGFCAAYIAKKEYPEATLVGLAHGEPAPTIDKGMHVLMLDFAYPREIMVDMARRAGSLLVLDHHATAEKELAGLPFAYFDMKRSGAGLTWDALHPKESRPWFVSYIEDRDLWNNRLTLTEEVSAYIRTLPYTIEAWAILEEMTWQDAASKGFAVLQYIKQYIRKVSDQNQVGKFLGHACAVVNAPYPNISELLIELIHREHVEIGLAYFERGDGKMQFSLRSVGDVDVSLIAKEYGGGGHFHAAGFEVPYVLGRHIVDSVLQRLPGIKYPFNPNSRGQADLDRAK